MMRDFSPGAKELLMQYVDDVIASGVWETIENGKGYEKGNRAKSG